MSITKVRNMSSPRTGREVANQFIIQADGSEIFQSYSTTIAVIDGFDVTLDEKALNYSRTTSKYLYQFLGENREQIQTKIDKGIYRVKDLNK